jgi:hypothetical protein
VDQQEQQEVTNGYSKRLTPEEQKIEEAIESPLHGIRNEGEPIREPGDAKRPEWPDTAWSECLAAKRTSRFVQ